MVVVVGIVNDWIAIGDVPNKIRNVTIWRALGNIMMEDMSNG